MSVAMLAPPPTRVRAPVPPARPLRPMTVREFFAALPPESRYTLIEGDCFMPPMPIPYHQKVVLNLYRGLDRHLAAQKLAGQAFGVPVDIVLDDHNVYQPDLCYFSAERAKGVLREKITTVPEFVVEVLSPATAKYDLGPKRRRYAQNGVEEYWIADPRKQTLAIFRFAENPDAPVETLTRPADTAAARVVSGWKITLREIFAD